MGRRTKVCTEEDKNRMLEAGERIKTSRKKHGLTLVSLADTLHISESMLRNYEKARYEVPKDVAEELVSLFGYTAMYWQGEPNAETEAGYWKAYWTRIDAAELAGYEAIMAREAEELRETKVFFGALDFGYDDLAEDPEYNFAGFVSGEGYDSPRRYCETGNTFYDELIKARRAKAPIRITDNSDEASVDPERWYLTNEEFNAMVVALRDVVRFHCFKANRRFGGRE